jgi:hypothetical protein
MRMRNSIIHHTRLVRSVFTLAFLLLCLGATALADPNYEVNTKLAPFEKGKTVVEHLDVWGEGRLDYKIDEATNVSGFKDSYNLNRNKQKVTTYGAPDAGREVPNLIGVSSFNVGLEGLFSPKSIKYLTLMNAPMVKKMAEDMADAVAVDGRILLYGSYKEFASEVREALQSKDRYKDENYYTSASKLPTAYPAKFKEYRSVDPEMDHVWEFIAK